MEAPTVPIRIMTTGSHYPDHCLDCPLLLRDTYGSVNPLRCVDCVAADRRVRSLIQEMILACF